MGVRRATCLLRSLVTLGMQTPGTLRIGRFFVGTRTGKPGNRQCSMNDRVHELAKYTLKPAPRPEKTILGPVRTGAQLRTARSRSMAAKDRCCDRRRGSGRRAR